MSSFTHNEFRVTAETAIDIDKEVEQCLEGMIGSLTAMRGGETTIATLRQLHVAAGEIWRTTAQTLAEINATQMPIGEAVAAAGGPDEVTGDKDYHTTG